MTLLEVMLAMGIISVAFLSMILVFTNGLKLMGQSTQFTEATEVARSFLEVTRRKGYATVTPGVYDGRPATPTPVSGTGFPFAPYPRATANKGEYTLLVEAVQVPAPPPNVRSVKVTVFWNANRSQTSLQTYVRP
jgi:type II secretory pathway pseudopilin PulG